MEIVDHGQVEIIAIVVALLGTSIVVPFCTIYGRRIVLEVKEFIYALIRLFETVFRNVS